MNTSGVLLFAKDPKIVPALHLQFRRRSTKKEYLAVCLGFPSDASFVVDAPLEKHPSFAATMCVGPDGKSSQTMFEVQSRDSSRTFDDWGRGRAWASPNAISAGACVVHCHPVTGRTHQIRMHLAHAGHPIIGDEVYGVEGPDINRQALHALNLTLCHPILGTDLTFHAPVPDDMVALMQQLQLGAGVN